MRSGLRLDAPGDFLEPPVILRAAEEGLPRGPAGLDQALSLDQAPFSRKRSNMSSMIAPTSITERTRRLRR